jgi:Secretion system C-terminal sorting domain
MDADEDPDILVFSNYNYAEVYDGTTLAVIDSFQGSFGSVRSMAVGNVDSLPDKELVLIGSDSLRVFSLLTKKLKWGMAIGGGDVTIGDIDADGRNEIFMGTFQGATPLQSYVVDGYTRTIRWTMTDAPMRKFGLYDVTGDGKLDLVGTDGNIIAYFNTTTRRAITLATAPTSAESFYIGDADGDGQAEILVGGTWSMTCFNLNGSARWAMPNTDGGATNLAVGNVDVNATPEVVWGAGANSSGSDHLIIGDFSTQRIKHASVDESYNHKILINDLDFDKKPKLVVATLGSYGYDAPDAGDPIAHNESALIQTFDLASHSLTRQTRYPYAVLSIEDFIIGSTRQKTGKDFGLAYSTYPVLFDKILTTPVYQTTSYSNTRCMTFADVDGDGLDEWLLGSYLDLTAMKWNGTTYNPLWTMPITGGVEGIKVQNIDADTTQEFVVYSLQSNIKVFNAKTRQLKWETPNLKVTALDIVDMDNDNKLDFLIGTDNGEVIIFDPRTQLIKKRSHVVSFTVRVLRGGNIDADTFGRTEIIVGDSKLKVIDGQTFAVKWNIPEHFTSDYGYNFDMGDVDGDGHIDLFIGNQSGVFQWRMRDTVFKRPFSTAQKELPPVASQLVRQFYPNPTREQLQVVLYPDSYQVTSCSWRIFDAYGRLVLSDKIAANAGQLTIPVQDLPMGFYLFQIQTGKTLETRHFVISKE